MIFSKKRRTPLPDSLFKLKHHRSNRFRCSFLYLCLHSLDETLLKNGLYSTLTVVFFWFLIITYLIDQTIRNQEHFVGETIKFPTKIPAPCHLRRSRPVPIISFWETCIWRVLAMTKIIPPSQVLSSKLLKQAIASYLLRFLYDQIK